ncbi:MAG TPA: hypothetical protein VF407_21955, partial [Polyangiaceae bacterium]
VVASSLALASVADAGPTIGRGVGAGTGKAAGAPTFAPTTPPPAQLGWPHTSLVAASSTKCGTTPAPNEVLIGTSDEKGNAVGCLSLAPGFYPSSEAVAKQWWVSSLRVGSAVRARAFRHEEYGQQDHAGFRVYAPNSVISIASSDKESQAIMSMRVEPANRSMTCDDVKPGEIALFEGWDRTGDCVVLPADNYPTAVSMGIANDSISGVNNQTDKRAIFFKDMSFVGLGTTVGAHTKLDRFSKDFDNQASSLQMSN